MKNSSNNTKNSHFVPRFYMKSFFNKNGELVKGDLVKNRLYVVSNLNAECSKKNIYSLKTKINSSEFELYKKLFLSDSSYNEKFINILIKYLNDELADLFSVKVKNNKEAEKIAREYMNKINNPDISRTQEELFTFVYENAFCDNVLPRIIKTRDISFINQHNNNVNEFLMYSWLKATNHIFQLIGKRIANLDSRTPSDIAEPIKSSTLKQKDNDFYDVFLFALMQYFRTSQMRDGFTMIMNQASEVLNFNNIDLNNVYFLFLHIQPIYMANNMISEGYKIILLENKTNSNFIFSDNPCINLYAALIDGRILNENEIEIFLPLSPSLALIFSNKDCYKNLSDFKIVLNSDNDIEQYNKALKFEANRYIYGHSEALIKKYLAAGANHISRVSTLTNQII